MHHVTCFFLIKVFSIARVSLVLSFSYQNCFCHCSGVQNNIRKVSIQRQDSRQINRIPNRGSKILQLPNRGSKVFEVKAVEELNKKTGLARVQKDAIKNSKDAHISPAKSNEAKIMLISKDKKRLLKHITPEYHYTGNRNEAQANKIALQRTDLPKVYANSIVDASIGSYRGRTGSIGTSKQFITKRDEEPGNPANFVPKNALNQIETGDKSREEGYESEAYNEPDINSWDEANGYKKEAYDYGRPYRRQQKDEDTPRRRWEDDEDEEEHHHHENITEHSSFEHKLTEKLLDAVLSEHGRHEYTEHNEHPNLGKTLSTSLIIKICR